MYEVLKGKKNESKENDSYSAGSFCQRRVQLAAWLVAIQRVGFDRELIRERGRD
jgi:hypothetical protein